MAVTPPQFISAAVPFVQLGNRRCLTDQQLHADDQLADFVQRFASSFEYDPTLMVHIFIEPDSARSNEDIDHHG